jgi:hypothetical protein
MLYYFVDKPSRVTVDDMVVTRVNRAMHRMSLMAENQDVPNSYIFDPFRELGHSIEHPCGVDSRLVVSVVFELVA